MGLKSKILVFGKVTIYSETWVQNLAFFVIGHLKFIHTYIHTYMHGVYMAPFHIEHGAEMEFKIRERQKRTKTVN